MNTCHRTLLLSTLGVLASAHLAAAQCPDGTPPRPLHGRGAPSRTGTDDNSAEEPGDELSPGPLSAQRIWLRSGTPYREPTLGP
jgi:hypothetical protein